MPRREPLGVWLDGRLVAEVTSTRAGEVRHRYTADALDRWPGNIPLVSCSLPLRGGRVDARVFYSGLLPEGRHRQAMAHRARVPSYDVFGMLERFGRDVAGALVLSREAPGERPGSVQPYTDAALAEEVSDLPDHPLGLHDDSELSIGGLQDKLLLVETEQGWGRPVHGRPSTHVLKVEDPRFPGMAEAEAGCLALARAVGLTTVEASVRVIADQHCLIVSRFDRAIGPGGAVQRVHQEDACQGLDRDPEGGRGRGKYEDAGGPSLREVASLLERYGQDPEAQLCRLAAVTCFTVCIGNADAHGRNVALLHPSPEHVELAPLYDTVPTALWPRLRSRGAMSIAGRWVLADVTVGDLVAEAASWRLSRRAAAASVVETAEKLLAAVEEPSGPDAVVELVSARARRLLATA